MEFFTKPKPYLARIFVHFFNSDQAQRNPVTSPHTRTRRRRRGGLLRRDVIMSLPTAAGGNGNTKRKLMTSAHADFVQLFCFPQFFFATFATFSFVTQILLRQRHLVQDQRQEIRLPIQRHFIGFPFQIENNSIE